MNLGTQHHFSDNLYAKENFIPAGYKLQQHKHKYDHLSVVAKGRCEVTVDDLTHIVEGPACLNIEAGKNHNVLALTDVVWYCIHSTSEKDPSKIDEVLIRINSPEEST